MLIQTYRQRGIGFKTPNTVLHFTDIASATYYILVASQNRFLRNLVFQMEILKKTSTDKFKLPEMSSFISDKKTKVKLDLTIIDVDPVILMPYATTTIDESKHVVLPSSYLFPAYFSYFFNITFVLLTSPFWIYSLTDGKNKTVYIMKSCLCHKVIHLFIITFW